MGDNTEPVVEVPHGHATTLGKGNDRTKRVKKAISDTTLGRIWLPGAGKEGNRFQGINLNPSGEFPHNEIIPNSSSNQDL